MAEITSYTTPPYPVHNADGISGSSRASNGKNSKEVIMPMGELGIFSYALNGQLREVLQTYLHEEALNSMSYALDGTLKTLLLTYTNPPESLNVSSYARNGTIRVTLIIYPNYSPESLNTSSYALNGTLT